MSAEETVNYFVACNSTRTKPNPRQVNLIHSSVLFKQCFHVRSHGRNVSATSHHQQLTVVTLG